MKSYIVNHPNAFDFLARRAHLPAQTAEYYTISVDVDENIKACARFEGKRDGFCFGLIVVDQGYSLTMLDLRQIFTLGFHSIGCEKIIFQIPHLDTKGRNFCTRLGLEHEATLKGCGPLGMDLMLFSAEKSTFKFAQLQN